ncbi:hypothetical protein OS175_13295 [Marinicella sp. S1101]|uniref:hypothetical protein n=1 Tax=Marinicella marina TaxID=2996016 RepID=UPI0022609260|nr:hypothetical protein [Marinicella marina]MCX7554849.1 hypothetical protein [Marinicella marina]MDJ1141507.1 hypothetical protein [Marinicella marina]
MKSKLIKPDWFIVEKYDQSKSFSKKQWLEQLSLRFLFYVLSQKEVANKPIKELFEKIQNQIYPQTDKGVVSLKKLVTNFTIDELSKEIHEIKLDKLDKEIKELFIAADNDEILDESGELTVEFERLIDEFSPLEKTQSLNENQQKRWAMHRVLAYFDLIIWCKINNYSIKNHGDITFTELTQWVFDDRNPYGVSRSQLKNVKKYESEMMNVSFLIEFYKYSK